MNVQRLLCVLCEILRALCGKKRIQNHEEHEVFHKEHKDEINPDTFLNAHFLLLPFYF